MGNQTIPTLTVKTLIELHTSHEPMASIFDHLPPPLVSDLEREIRLKPLVTAGALEHHDERDTLELLHDVCRLFLALLAIQSVPLSVGDILSPVDRRLHTWIKSVSHGASG